MPPILFYCTLTLDTPNWQFSSWLPSFVEDAALDFSDSLQSLAGAKCRVDIKIKKLLHDAVLSMLWSNIIVECEMGRIVG